MSVTLKDNTKEFLSLFESAKKRGLESIGDAMVGHAKKKAPVDTGKLRGSITATVEGNAVSVGTDVEYAPFVELGTSKMKARPFLRPAATEHTAEYKQIMEDALKNAKP